MSIEKIGNMDPGIAIHQRPAGRKLQTADIGSDIVVRNAKADLTRISYPPFLPIGDTQSIYKK